jgi:hypothetical protein
VAAERPPPGGIEPRARALPAEGDAPPLISKGVISKGV